MYKEEKQLEGGETKEGVYCFHRQRERDRDRKTERDRERKNKEKHKRPEKKKRQSCKRAEDKVCVAQL